jgi:hypothetical protein
VKRRVFYSVRNDLGNALKEALLPQQLQQDIAVRPGGVGRR